MVTMIVKLFEVGKIRVEVYFTLWSIKNGNTIVNLAIVCPNIVVFVNQTHGKMVTTFINDSPKLVNFCDVVFHWGCCSPQRNGLRCCVGSNFKDEKGRMAGEERSSETNTITRGVTG